MKKKMGKKRGVSLVLAAFALAVLLQPQHYAAAQSIEDLDAGNNAETGTGDAVEAMAADGGAGTGDTDSDSADTAGTAEDGNADSGIADASAGGGNGPANITVPDGSTIADGIFIGTVDVSGMTADEAVQAVEAHVEEARTKNLTLNAVDDHQVTVTVGDLGLVWGNPEIAMDAVALGKKGNVIQRYKALQDLRHENHVFELTYDLDKDLVSQFLTEQCTPYNSEAQDAKLVKTESGFSVTPGTTGYIVDEEASLTRIYDRSS